MALWLPGKAHRSRGWGRLVHGKELASTQSCMHPSTPYPLPLFSDACDHWLARPDSFPKTHSTRRCSRAPYCWQASHAWRSRERCCAPTLCSSLADSGLVAGNRFPSPANTFVRVYSMLSVTCHSLTLWMIRLIRHAHRPQDRLSDTGGTGKCLSSFSWLKCDPINEIHSSHC